MGKKDVFYKDAQHRLRHYSEDEAKMDNHESKEMVNENIVNEKDINKMVEKIIELGKDKVIYVARLTPEEYKKTQLGGLRTSELDLDKLNFVNVYYYKNYGLQYVLNFRVNEDYYFVKKDIENQLTKVLKAYYYLI
jgi:hypothetical protein